MALKRLTFSTKMRLLHCRFCQRGAFTFGVSCHEAPSVLAPPEKNTISVLAPPSQLGQKKVSCHRGKIEAAVSIVPKQGQSENKFPKQGYLNKIALIVMIVEGLLTPEKL
ncbi:hypothetical protein PIB30_022636 [Stylosanthes scabra]|uniref:Uncharacterized protein n=1 Tax=Stylosanthes scabra TaxID=79078 RepID=A0ABU6T8Z5_9FABA|nr:hypothetical protein [Stylosanthes scabra]